MPDFTCNFAQVWKPFVHFWEHTVGSGHAPRDAVPCRSTISREHGKTGLPVVLLRLRGGSPSRLRIEWHG